MSNATLTCDGKQFTTNASGYYQISNLANGKTFVVTANYSGVTQSKSATTPSSSGTVILNFSLEIPVYYTTIIGNATSENGSAIGANVTCDGVLSVTDDYGYFELRNVTSGATLNLTISYLGNNKTVSVTTPEDGGVLDIGTIDIEAIPSVTPIEVGSSSSISIWAMFSLIALLIIVLIVGYLLYTRNK